MFSCANSGYFPFFLGLLFGELDIFPPPSWASLGDFAVLKFLSGIGTFLPFSANTGFYFSICDFPP